MAMVCPWWFGYFLVNSLRRLVQKPSLILAPYVREGMTVLEPGPGMGFFTLELARMVGPAGCVVAVDIQRRMIDALKRRLNKAGLEERVDARLVQAASLNIGDLEGAVDFALAFSMVHELPDPAAFFAEIACALKRGGLVLLSEPPGHVTAPKFDAELAAAAKSGLEVVERPSVRGSRAALLRKP